MPRLHAGFLFIAIGFPQPAPLQKAVLKVISNMNIMSNMVSILPE
jgi:hypothetical protein